MKKIPMQTLFDDIILYTEGQLTNFDASTELDKAKEIVSQLESSIDFLYHLIAKESDPLKKAALHKEVTAAQWEIDRLNKEIKKATNE